MFDLPSLIAYLLISIVVVLAAFPFVFEYYVGTVDPFSPIFWSTPLFVILYCVPAFGRLYTRSYEFRGTYKEHISGEIVIQLIMVAAILALLALLAGYYIGTGKRYAQRLPMLRSEWSSDRAGLMILIFTAIGYIGYGLLLPSVGTGPRTELSSGFSKYAFIAVNLLNTASVLIMADLFISTISYDDCKIKIQNLRKTVIGGGMVVVNMAILWTLGGRGRAFMVGIIALFLIHYLVRRFSILGGFGTFSILYVIPAWAARLMAAVLSLDVGRFLHHLTHPVLFRDTPSPAFNQVYILFSNVPGTLEFQYGLTFISAFFEFLPFQPVPETQVIYNQAFFPSVGSTYGFPVTLMGELYMNFWLPGVVIGFFIAGIGIRFAYEWAIIQSASPAAIAVFAAIANDYLLIGNFSNSAPQFGLKLLPILIAVLYISGGLKAGSRAGLEPAGSN